MTALIVVRYVLPAAAAIAGVVLIAIGGDAEVGAGIVLIGVAAVTVIANLLIRLAIASEEDRAREERRRRGP
jgi:hypothetical protein